MIDCKKFDRFRDREMNASEQSAFEAHLAVCDDCRAKMSLLENIVRVLKQEEVQAEDLAEWIAAQAFRRLTSWDSILVSWLRPRQALAAIALALVFVSFVWFFPGNRQVNLLSEYEELMIEADTIIPGTDISQANADSELVLWLQQEGSPQ
jgi:predicted anti-sigma-YlaC factor YlaD